MATQNTLIVSGSNFTPGNAIATSSLGALTGSMLGANAFKTLIVSSSIFTGSLPRFFSGSLGASASIAAVTSSMLGGLVYTTNLYGYTSAATTGSSGGTFTAVTYVLSGYYVAGATRETWSGPSINTPTPTGHPLVDITVMGSYPPQNSAT